MNIIVIDDDPIARMLITRYLAISGFTGDIYTAENGEEGFELINSTAEPMVIVLDYHMPVMDGSELLKKLDSHQINHPVFLLSSSCTTELDKENQTYEWVQGYFEKPINLDKAKSIIEFLQVHYTL